MSSLTLVAFAITAAIAFARHGSSSIGAPTGASYTLLTVNCPESGLPCPLFGQVCDTPGTLYGLSNVVHPQQTPSIICWDQVSNSTTEGLPFFASFNVAALPPVGVIFSKGLFCETYDIDHLTSTGCPAGYNCTAAVYASCSY